MVRRALWVLALSLFACGRPSGPPPKTIRIGAVIDRTGINSEPSWSDAIRLAERNANAGLRKTALKDIRFQVLLQDSSNEPAVGLQRAIQLVHEEGVKALITDTSQVDVEIHKTFYDADPGNDLGVPVQCGSCTSGTINNPTASDPDPVAQAALRNSQGWNFRSIMSTKLISQILIRLLMANNNGDVNGDGKFKISYLGSDEVFGRGAVKDLRTYANQLYTADAPIIEELYHPRDADPNSYDWAADARRLADAQTGNAIDGFPDAVVIANFAQQQAAFVKAYRQGGYAVRLLHYHTFRISSALQALGSLADGAEGVSHVLLDNGVAGETFALEYEERYGIPVVYRDAIYYDTAMTMMLAAMVAAKGMEDPSQVTGAQIRDAMKKISDPAGELVGPGPDEFARAVELIGQGKAINYNGASGPMDFDANGNVLGRLAQYRAEEGQFVDVAKFDCVKDASCPSVPVGQ